MPNAARAASAGGSLPTGTVTFAFTEIEGSTQRWERDRAAMQVAVRRHGERMRAAILAHGGHLFKLAIGHGGQVLVSGVTADLVQGDLPARAESTRPRRAPAARPDATRIGLAAARARTYGRLSLAAVARYASE